MTTEGTRLVELSEDLVSVFGGRTDSGLALSYKWGEPDARGIWTPTVTTTDDGKIVVDRAEYERDKEQAWMYRDLLD